MVVPNLVCIGQTMSKSTDAIFRTRQKRKFYEINGVFSGDTCAGQLKSMHFGVLQWKEAAVGVAYRLHSPALSMLTAFCFQCRWFEFSVYMWYYVNGGVKYLLTWLLPQNVTTIISSAHQRLAHSLRDTHEHCKQVLAITNKLCIRVDLRSIVQFCHCHSCDVNASQRCARRCKSEIFASVAIYIFGNGVGLNANDGESRKFKSAD